MVRTTGAARSMTRTMRMARSTVRIHGRELAGGAGPRKGHRSPIRGESPTVAAAAAVDGRWGQWRRRRYEE